MIILRINVSDNEDIRSNTLQAWAEKKRVIMRAMRKKLNIYWPTKLNWPTISHTC